MPKILKSIDKNFVEIEAELIAETPQAILIFDGVVEVWIPKSMLENEIEGFKDNQISIVIPEWFAIKKELI